jgi:hypothetical protein
MGSAEGSTAAVEEASGTFIPEAANPLADGGTRDIETTGGLGLGEAAEDEIDKTAPAFRSEGRVRMNHEGLRWMVSDNLTQPDGPLSVNVTV